MIGRREDRRHKQEAVDTRTQREPGRPGRAARSVITRRRGTYQRPEPLINADSLVRRTSAGGDVVASVRFDHATPAVHVLRSNPVGERAVGPVLVAPLRHHVEIAIGAEELLAPATIGRVGVEDLSYVVPEEDAVAGEIFEARVAVPIVVLGASRRD